MPVSAKPAAGTYTVNTGATYCPHLLYMCDEGTGTTLTNVGKGIACDGTLAAFGTGSTPTWGTISQGAVVDFSRVDDSNGGMLTTANLLGQTGTTGSYVGIVIAEIKTGTNEGFLIGSGRADSFQFDNMRTNKAAKSIVRANNYTNSVGVGVNDAYASFDVQYMFAFKLKQNAVGTSVDGGAWATSATGPTFWPTQDDLRTRYRIGARATATPGFPCAMKLLAVAIYNAYDPDDAAISAIWNSGDPWTSFGVTSVTTFNPAWTRGSNILIGVGQ